MAKSRNSHNSNHHRNVRHSRQKLLTLVKKVRHHGEFQHIIESLFTEISRSHQKGSGYLRPWGMAW